jgi:hypothetical protein
MPANGRWDITWLLKCYDMLHIGDTSEVWSISSSLMGLPWQATEIPQRIWLIVLPALQVPTVATRRPRAYRHIPHSSGQSWNLWAEKDRYFYLDADFHGTSRDLLHAADLATWDPRIYFPSEGRCAEDFSALKNPTASAGFESAKLGTRGQHANP